MTILKIIAYYNMLWKIKIDEGKKWLFWKGTRESASKQKTFKLKPESYKWDTTGNNQGNNISQTTNKSEKFLLQERKRKAIKSAHSERKCIEDKGKRDGEKLSYIETNRLWKNIWNLL